MTVAELLLSQRGSGPTRSAKMLHSVALSEKKTLGSLTKRQRVTLAAVPSSRENTERTIRISGYRQGVRELRSQSQEKPPDEHGDRDQRDRPKTAPPVPTQKHRSRSTVSWILTRMQESDGGGRVLLVIRSGSAELHGRQPRPPTSIRRPMKRQLGLLGDGRRLCSVHAGSARWLAVCPALLYAR
jgi:hypothetical protein